MTDAMITLLFGMICWVETEGNANKIAYVHGKPHAYGPAQITAAALKDVNEYAHTGFTLRDFLGNMPLSKMAFEVYTVKRYGAKTPGEAAAIWHFGYEGSKRAHPDDDYVTRVMNLYNERKQAVGK